MKKMTKIQKLEAVIVELRAQVIAADKDAATFDDQRQFYEKAWLRDRDALINWQAKMKKRANGVRLLSLLVQTMKEANGLKSNPFEHVIKAIDVTVKNMAETAGIELPMPEVPPLDAEELKLWEAAKVKAAETAVQK